MPAHVVVVKSLNNAMGRGGRKVKNQKFKKLSSGMEAVFFVGGMCILTFSFGKSKIKIKKSKSCLKEWRQFFWKGMYSWRFLVKNEKIKSTRSKLKICYSR